MLIRNPRNAEVMQRLEAEVMALRARPRPDLVRPLEEIQREAIESALILCAGDRCLAAERLGISRAAMYRYVRCFRAENDVTPQINLR